MVPKIIHYCWFGKKPLPKLAIQCISSWKKYCPDYKIIQWDEKSFDVNINQFVKGAYNSKKFAYVTDYVRLYVLYKYGGIYMDTDVEVIKPIDRFLVEHAFSGYETSASIPTGIMASEKGFPLCYEWLKDYDSLEFRNDEQFCIDHTNVVMITNAMEKAGMVFNNQYQVIKNMAFYPREFFCPKDYQTGIVTITLNTYTIHHFSGSWHSKSYQVKSRIRRIIIKLFGNRGIELIKKIKKLAVG